MITSGKVTSPSGEEGEIEVLTMDEKIGLFVEEHPDAAMITLRRDGSAHMARIEVGVVDGRIWSSGGPELVRTRNLKRDPRCSLFVFVAHPEWVGLETKVSLLEGPEDAQMHVELMRARHGDAAPEGMVLGHDDELGRDRLYSEEEYLSHIERDGRLIYEFEIERAYGNF
jgi:hypothetical protein